MGFSIGFLVVSLQSIIKRKNYEEILAFIDA